ncbi:MAG TPA: Wzz/FepE/Etk N-terminal domain-containing protein [Candidatus Krumholzibacteria bacterium]|nr:Wzz/FepE/Etk N-terminal domain-containing protein [Candidatus Krumholzibacteria bacterium]
MSGLYSQGPVQGERDTTMRDLLSVVFKRKWLIIIFFLGTSALVAVKVVTTPKTWSADATLMLQRQGRTSVLENSGRALPWVEVMESEVEIARSVPVLQLARAKLQEPTKDFPDGIDVSMGALGSQITSGGVGESNVVYITSTADQYKKAIRIANTVAEAYVEYHKKMFALPDAASAVKVQADSTLKALSALQEERQRVLKEAGSTDLVTEESNLHSLQRELRSNLSEAELKISTLQAQVAAIPKDVDGITSDLPFDLPRGFAQPEVMLTALEKYRKSVQKLEELRTQYTEAHPQVKTAEIDLEQSRKTLESSIRQLVSLKTEELNVAKAKRDDILRQIHEIEAQLAKMPDFTRKVSFLDTQIDSAEKQYAKLNSKYVDTHLSQVSYQDYGVSLLSPAVSAYKNTRGDLVRMALAPLLSLLAGIGLAFYLENLDHSMKTREDVEHHLEIPVLASFPDVDEGESDLEPEVRRNPFWKGRRGGR